MASRAEQKAAARARREAQMAAATQQQARRMRLIYMGGIVAVVALAIVIVAIAASGGKKPVSASTAKAKVASLLAGIPQNGNTLGNPNAKVTLYEYGDLVCPICRDFATSSEESLIRNEVRQGKVKIVYRAAETASQTANGGEFVAGQVAALAAGRQHLAWNYILLWYLQQKDETTSYVNNAWLQNLAQQIPGLNLTKWQAARNDPALTTQVQTDLHDMTQLVAQYKTQYATPMIFLVGPKGSVPPVAGVPTYSALHKTISSIS